MLMGGKGSYIQLVKEAIYLEQFWYYLFFCVASGYSPCKGHQCMCYLSDI